MHAVHSDSLKALYLLKQNIRALMTLRHIDQPGLAKWVGHSKAWINKFLNDPVAEIQIKDLDKIADALGVATYQLFQPGTVHLTERRSAVDRRRSRERRIGQAGRQLATLRTELDKLPHPQRVHATATAARAAAVVPEPVQRVLAAAERQIAAIYAELGRQTASTGTDGAVVPGARRKLRGSAHRQDK